MTPQHNKLFKVPNVYDPYNWMRDPNWPEVKDPKILKYLETENEKYSEVMNKIKQLTDKIKQELLERMNEYDYTVPYKEGNYFYYSRITRNCEYWIHIRKKSESLDLFNTIISENEKNIDDYSKFAFLSDAPIGKLLEFNFFNNGTLFHDEEIILDENTLSHGNEYLNIRTLKISPQNENLLAYSIDQKGDERYSIRVKDLLNSVIIDQATDDTMGEIVWRQDGDGFFYIPAGKNWRSSIVMYHKIGTTTAEDKLIYEEHDDCFHVYCYLSESKEYIFITTSNQDITETRVLDSKDQNMTPYILIKRDKKLIYKTFHSKDKFYYIINDRGTNMRLLVAKIQDSLDPKFSDNYIEYTKEVIAHNPDEYLENAIACAKGVALFVRIAGLTTIKILSLTGNIDILDNTIQPQIHSLTFPEVAYDIKLSKSNYHASIFRYSYSSLSRPVTIYEYKIECNTGIQPSEPTSLKEAKMPTSFDIGDYIVERIFVRSGNANVPVSIVYRRENKNKAMPLLLYGYGAYGISTNASFRGGIISLIDRGFIYAIAHIRGGSELGRKWYEDGKMLSKKNSFMDFIAAAEYLIHNGYAEKDKIIIHGGSAGGLLVAACVNMRPDLFHTVVAEVPFVDVMNTMLDHDLPLTPGEYQEWGNPRESKEIYEYIISYSPYENVKTGTCYNNFLITAGLNDPRVGYWEPAKWAARLKESNTNPNSVILLQTDTSSGHGGKSGRYQSLQEQAEKLAFMIWTINN